MSEQDWDELPEPEFDIAIKHYGRSPFAEAKSKIAEMNKEMDRMKKLSQLGEILITMDLDELTHFHNELRRTRYFRGR